MTKLTRRSEWNHRWASGQMVDECVPEAAKTKGEKTGQWITEGGFNKAWRRARIAAGCPGRIPHDFRRTAVRNLVRAGVPERVAMQLTGHKTRAVFERYNIVSPGDLRDAAQRLDTYTSASAV